MSDVYSPAERTFEQFVERSPDIVLRYDRGLRHLYVSPSVEAATGLPPEHYIGRTNRELGVDEELCAYWDDKLARVFDSGAAETFEWEMETVAGPRWFEAYVVPETADDGTVATVVSYTRDRTATHRAEQRHSDLVGRAPDAIFTADLTGRFISANPASARITRYSVEELLAMSVFDLIAPEGQESAHILLAQRIADGAPESVELELVAKDGGRVFVEVSGRVVDEPGSEPYLEAIARETTDRHILEESLRHAVFHDPLTQLPNRALLNDRLAQALARSDRGETEVAVLILDVDDFKLVNDSLGHAAGDEVLMTLARRLRRIIRGSETFARLGGDEFALIAEGLRAEGDVVAIANRVLSVFDEPFTAAGVERRMTGSVGVALATVGTETSDLLRDADTAMYHAKQGGKNRFELFDDALRHQLLQQLALRNALEEALAAGDLEVRFQPIVSISNGQILAAETLVRWPHPEWGWVKPDEFVPLAEETGLIVPLGRFVLAAACAHTSAWRERFPSAMPLGTFVNVSPHELGETDFASFVADTLAAHGLEPSDVTLELTERAFIDEGDDIVMSNLETLAHIGVPLVIDDFGTGYSSLASLKRFPLVAVKIDRFFVHGIVSPTAEAPVTRAVVSLSKTLGMTVIAEGVENRVQLDYLRRIGCDAAQGFLFGHPQPAAELTELLALRSGANGLTARVERPPVVPTPRRSSADAPIPDNDDERLAALWRYKVLDTEPEPELDEIVRLAAQICETPMAFISLVDRDREFFKAAYGSDLRESPRSISFCGHAIAEAGPLVVPDAREDDRFAHNPNVVSGAGVRFYAGVPIVSPDGHAIGVLCVKDTRPRVITGRQLSALTVLGHQVVTRLELDLLRAAGSSEAIPGASFEPLFDRIDSGVITVDASNRITRANPAACRQLGYSEQELVGRNGHELIHHSHADGSPYPEVDCAFAQQRRHGPAAWSGDEVLWRKDGSHFEIDFSSIETISGDGRPGSILLFRDVTARNAAQRELTAAAARLRLGLTGSGLSVFTMDRDLRYTWIENSALGHEPGEIVGKTDDEILPQQAAAELTELKQRVIARGESVDAEIPVELQDQTAWYRLTAQPLRGEAGDIVGVAGQMTDVTLRKSIEHRLRRTHALYEAIVDNSPDMIALTDVDRTFLFASRAFETVLGYRPDELVGRGIGTLLEPAADERNAAVMKGLLDGTPAPLLHDRMCHKNGSIVPVEGTIAVVDAKDGLPPLFLSVNRDISARLEMEERNRHAQKTEAIGQVASTLAHDFSNLLAAISGLSELALEHGLAHEPNIDEIARIQSTVRDARELTGQLSTFSRRQPPAIQAVSLSDCVTSAVPRIKEVVGPQIEVSTTLARDAPECLADPAALDRVLLNLAANARDAMPAGGEIHICTRVRSTAPENAGAAAHRWLALGFADTGAGMDRATRDRIFEPFFTTKPPGEGLGLGLASVKELVGRSGGTIDVRSRPGHGTRFTLYLPAAEADPVSA